MKFKLFLLTLVSMLSLTLMACNNNGPVVEPETEYVIKDSVLTQSQQIDDNYRVFYEIMTGSFSDSNQDGIGDLRGIINRLDYLNDGNPNSGKSLGIQGIWLTPIFKSPTYHKYDITDYYAIDSKFGTLDDLKELIAECHERNIKLIIDLPINHTGNNNVWFKNFINAHKNNDTTNAYYDFYSYYTYGKETAPIGRQFSRYTGTDVCYECNFTSNMPELNFDNELVRNEVLNVAKYYLDLGIDGFRFDAAKYIYYGDNEKSAQFWNWYVNELKKIKPDIYTIGEVWDADSITYKYFEQGLSCFNFTTSQASGKIATTAKSAKVSVYTKYVEDYLNTIKQYGNDLMIHSFIANHDTDRAAGFVPVSTKQAYMAANLYILAPGSPFIYYGEEIGMKGSRGGETSDANRRLAMLWGDDDTIKDPLEATYNKSNQSNGTVLDQLLDETSLYNHYKKLIMIRNAFPEIARGEYVSLTSDITSVGGFTSTYENSTVCVIHNNHKTDTFVYDLSQIKHANITEICTYVGTDGVKIENGKLTITPQTTVILK